MTELISETLKHEIFEKIKPKLTTIGYKYKIADPQGSAISFWARYCDIISEYNATPELQRLFFSKGPALPITQIDEYNKQDWMRSITAYLVTIYRNEILGEFKKGYRDAKYARQLAPLLYTGPPIPTQEVDADRPPILLAHLLEIVKRDATRQAASATLYNEIILALLLEGMVAHYTELLAKYGNINIVKQYDADCPRNFFITDINDSIAEQISQTMMLKQNDYGKVVKSKIYELCSEPNHFKLRKRVSSYNLKFKGGIIARLKKRK